MIARLALMVIAAGCSSPSLGSGTVTNRQPSVRRTAAGCPVLGINQTVWRHEVFPGCPALPFAYPFLVCVGECPRPYRARTLSTRLSKRSNPILPADTTEVFYEYDAKGNWVASRLGGTLGEKVDECLYEGDRIASCGDGYEQWQRRDDGRLVSLLTGSRRELWMTVTYDGHGDARELVFPTFNTTHRFTYDSDHRLIEHRASHGGSETVVTLTYQAGRLVSQEAPLGRTLFSYDDRGRLIRLEQHAGPGGDDYDDVVTIEYDGQDRVVKIVEDPRKYGGPVTTMFDYDGPSTMLDPVHIRSTRLHR